MQPKIQGGCVSVPSLIYLIVLLCCAGLGFVPLRLYCMWYVCVDFRVIDVGDWVIDVYVWVIG